MIAVHLTEAIASLALALSLGLAAGFWLGLLHAPTKAEKRPRVIEHHFEWDSWIFPTEWVDAEIASDETPRP